MGRRFQSPEESFGYCGGPCGGTATIVTRVGLFGWAGAGQGLARQPRVWGNSTRQRESGTAELRTLMYLQSSSELLGAIHKPCTATAQGCAPPAAVPPSPHRHHISEAGALFASPAICRVTRMAENATLAKSRLTGYILLIQRPTKSVTSVTGKTLPSV